MTDTQPEPVLRRHLLMRAAVADDCTATERDQILKHMFPGLDRDQTLPKLRDLWTAHHNNRPDTAEQIITDLITQDRLGRRGR